MKFGGTSVKNASAMKNVIDIVKARQNQNPVVVLSACSGITDRLFKLIQNAGKKSPINLMKEITTIENYHLDIIDELINKKEIKKNCSDNIRNLIQQLTLLVEGVSLLRECTPRSLDASVSFGELMSTIIFEAACRDRKLNSVFFDVRHILKTDSNFTQANVNFQETKKSSNEHILPLSSIGKIVITQGFIGSDENGVTTTLGRGGSDYTAAVLGSVLNAKEIQIWTDVNGVLSADPRIDHRAVTIPEMSFDEISELSYYGAKVLHPDTIKPAIQAKIPVRVLNTFHPENKGTLITEITKEKTAKIRSVHLKRNCINLIINIPHSDSTELKIIYTLSQLFKSGIKIVSTSFIDNRVLITIDNSDESTINSIKNILYGLDYKIENVCLLCICGVNLLKDSEILQKATNSLNRFEQKSILYGFSSTSMIISVPEENAAGAMNSIHNLILLNINDDMLPEYDFSGGVRGKYAKRLTNNK